MADRRRCRGSTGHHTLVERGGVSACDSGGYGERNTFDSKAKRLSAAERSGAAESSGEVLTSD